MRPPEIRELVSVRRDTLSHAYELMKVQDPRKRRRLAKQVAAGELSLVKLRQRIEGKPRPEPRSRRRCRRRRRRAETASELPPELESAEALEHEPEIELVAVPIAPDGPAVDG